MGRILEERPHIHALGVRKLIHDAFLEQARVRMLGTPCEVGVTKFDELRLVFGRVG